MKGLRDASMNKSAKENFIDHAHKWLRNNLDVNRLLPLFIKIDSKEIDLSQLCVPFTQSVPRSLDTTGEMSILISNVETKEKQICWPVVSFRHSDRLFPPALRNPSPCLSKI